MTKKKGNNNLRTFLGILVIGVIISFYFYNTNRLENNRHREDKEYTPIKKLRGGYRGRILSKSGSKGYTGRNLLQLTDNVKLSISGGTRNYLYSGQDLAFFMKVGDSIFKPLGSDSLYIIRNNRTYYFILGKMINDVPD